MGEETPRLEEAAQESAIGAQPAELGGDAEQRRALDLVAGIATLGDQRGLEAVSAADEQHLALGLASSVRLRHRQHREDMPRGVTADERNTRHGPPSGDAFASGLYRAP